MTGEQQRDQEGSAPAATSEAEHHAQLLGQALGECIVAAGITRPDASLSGPELLMFAEDLKRHLTAQAAGLSEQDERLAFEAKFPPPTGVSFHEPLKRYCVGAQGTFGEMELYQSAWEAWKARAAAAAPAVEAEPGDAFNVDDPELNDLLNLAVDIHTRGGNHDSAEYLMQLLKRVEARLAVQTQQQVVDVMRFELKHPANGESHAVVFTRDEVAEGLEDTLYEKLGGLICHCEPVGETNVVDCNCDEYIHDFELQQAACPAKVNPKPVAYRIVRKTQDGLWTTEGRPWIDGLPSANLLKDVAGRPGECRLMYAFTSPVEYIEQQPIELTWPEYHHEGMGCGLEDRGITDRYEACQYGFEQAVEQMACMLPDVLYAEPVMRSGSVLSEPDEPCVHEFIPFQPNCSKCGEPYDQPVSGQDERGASQWLDLYEQDLTLLLQLFASEVGPTERKNLRANLAGIRQFIASRPAQAEPKAPLVPRLTAAELSALREFHGAVCCDAGHTVEKKSMSRLAEIGAVESVGFGKHRLTEFGTYLLSATVQENGHD